MKAQFHTDGERAYPAGAPLADATLAPLLAGARARGMADAFELLGVAAAFIDESGCALHINERARGLIGPQLWVDEGRLRAAEPELDEALGAAIEAALNADAHDGSGTNLTFASESRGPLAVKVLPFLAEAHDPFQLLRAVVVIEEQGAAARRPPMARRDGLN